MLYHPSLDTVGAAALVLPDAWLLDLQDPSSVFLPEVSYFPFLGFFKFLLTQFGDLGAESVTAAQCVKAQWDNVEIVILGNTNKIWLNFIW